MRALVIAVVVLAGCVTPEQEFRAARRARAARVVERLQADPDFAALPCRKRCQTITDECRAKAWGNVFNYAFGGGLGALANKEAADECSLWRNECSHDCQ